MNPVLKLWTLAALVLVGGTCAEWAAADVVSDWNAIGVQTIVAAGRPACAGTTHLAVMHLAVYDAVESIDRRFEPYAVRVRATRSASREAAAVTAAYQILLADFPAQAASLDAAYGASLAAIADGPAKAEGTVIGDAIAQALLALRARDGREATVPYVAGTTPGAWQPTPPLQLPAQTPWVGQMVPFTMTRADEFLPEGGPPPLDSSDWADNYDAVRVLGALDSSARTAAQTEIGLFWTENPAVQTNRAYRALAAAHNLGTSDSARFFAMVVTAGADSCIGCFNAKYHFNFWRPVTAIRAGDSDGNPATVAEPGWAPLGVTPNHPEYPAAHGCYTAATMRVMAGFFATDAIPIVFTSATTGTVHRFARLSDVVREVGVARVYGGMHYPQSVRDGETLGNRIADRLLERFFRRTE